MHNNMSPKVQARHLKRNAYLYVRQSTLRQVVEHTESTQRQYDLRKRAVALGWSLEKITLIDSDLGRSGASAADREGFQLLVTEVSMGRAGIVMGLEVSRLARNCTDWHRLLEICALTDTLILDEDGVYDPAHFNDRLLLGLKGAMSEAELHVLRARLRGGVLNAARRGALRVGLPIGLVYDVDGQVQLDPDVRVRETVSELFRTFRRSGSAAATAKAFRKQGLKFPRRSDRGELVWTPLNHHRVLTVLKNPRYAGAFVFGRTRQQKLPDGRIRRPHLPREEWFALIHDAHDGYVTWEEYEENQLRLRENASAYGVDRRGPPREGPALLQGLAICAVCGDRMTVRYHVYQGSRVPEYVCQRRPICQTISGKTIDDAVGELLVETVSPVTLEVALAVQHELEQRAAELDRLRAQEVEEARYAAELARRRYMQVDPDNRLVADALEANWNEKLRAVASAQEHYEARGKADRLALDEQQRVQILQLATDFPRLWNAPTTPDRERKRMVRLLIEDVTLRKGEQMVDVAVRFKGGVTRTLHLSRPKPAWMLTQTPAEIVADIDRLLDEHTDAEIAKLLNERGKVSGRGLAFNTTTVRNIRISHNLKSRYQRLRERGLIDKKQMAARLGISVDTLKIWRRTGRIHQGYTFNNKGERLFEPPGEDAPRKASSYRKSPQSRSDPSGRSARAARGAV